MLHVGLLILRISAGLYMLIGHGIGKFNRAFSGDEIAFADPFGLGPALSLYLVVFAEFFCSILLILGVYTRVILIPLIVTMVVAVFIANAGKPFADMEKAALFLSIFVALMFTGPGKYSVDGIKNKPVS